ncbi:MAG: DUF711 family protein, partial [Oscillospiraceae bacterium]|nr:DUF711 family protein [Oscillospiraceae bacterium]
MMNSSEIIQTIRMIDQQHLDVRTVTMGINLLDCADSDIRRCGEKIYDKLCRTAERLVPVCCEIEQEFGIPIVNKRISVTPVSLVAASCVSEEYELLAGFMDRAAQEVGVNFIGGFSALCQKGLTDSDLRLIRAIPRALTGTELVCASVNVGSTKAGINMDAVRQMGMVIRETAELGSIGCAKLVVFCNAVEDNPFMAGAFHGPGEPECVINVGVSGPGVVAHALKECKGEKFDTVAETIKRTAFKITRMGQLVAQEASRRLDVPFGVVDL